MADKIFSGTMKILLFVGSILGSFIAVTLAINSLVYVPLNTAIAQEVTKRENTVSIEAEKRDKTDKEIRQELKEAVENQSAITNQLLLKVTEVVGDIKLIKALSMKKNETPK